VEVTFILKVSMAKGTVRGVAKRVAKKTIKRIIGLWWK
jgi:hypothetical protein